MEFEELAMMIRDPTSGTMGIRDSARIVMGIRDSTSGTMGVRRYSFDSRVYDYAQV